MKDNEPKARPDAIEIGDDEEVSFGMLDNDEDAQDYYWEHVGWKDKEAVPADYWQERDIIENKETIRILDRARFDRIVLGNKNIDRECVDGCPALDMCDSERDCRVLGIDRLRMGQAYGAEPFNHGWDVCRYVVQMRAAMWDLFFNKDSKVDQHDREFWHWLDEKHGIEKRHDHSMLVDEFIEFLEEKHPELLRDEAPEHESWEELDEE